MNKKSIVRLIVGILLLALLIFIIILAMDQRRSTVEADNAELFTTSYTVGTDHGGIVTQQFVDVGDSITAGQVLFHLNSSSVQEGLRSGDIQEGNLLYKLNDEGQLMITSQVAGVISELTSPKGSFVPANSRLAEIADTNAVGVRAEFTLPRRDFNKLNTDSQLDVRLPDGSWLSTSIGNLRVVEQEELITAQVESDLDNINLANYETISGTPVQSRVHLTDRTLYDRTSNFFKDKLPNTPFSE